MGQATFDALVLEITRGVTRFAMGIGAGNNDGKPVLGHYMKVDTQDFSSLSAMLDHYIERHGGREEMPPVLAISHAGPQIGERIIIPGSQLSFSIAELEQTYDFRKIVNANDCVALGASLNWLASNDFASIAKAQQPAYDHEPGRYALVVPTYGLGMACVIHTGDAIQVIDSEGGHANFAPCNKWYAGLVASEAEKGRFLSTGDIISYPGLERLYRHVAAGQPGAVSDLRAQEILLYARNEADTMCIEAIRLFAEALGALAGDAALTMGAVDGVFLVSPFVSELVDLGDQMEQIVRQKFESKIDFALYMERIPLYLITHRRASMLGVLRLACENPAAQDAPVPAASDALSA